MEAKTKKKGFTMPHLLWIMLGLLLVASLLTYIVPAGQFATDKNGKILGDQFQFLGDQTPVNPFQVLMMILPGLTKSANVSWMVMVCGAMTAVVMATGAFDSFMNWSIYKLGNKNQGVLYFGMFMLMVYLGGFGGSDALVAIVPLGVMFAKKMDLDPLCALGFSTFATCVGFGTGPVKQSVSQGLMGVRIYGAFFTMFLSMNFFMIVAFVLLMRYVKRIRRDPTKSLMYSEGWRPTGGSDINLVKEEPHLSWRAIAVLIVFLGQYILIVAYPLIGGKIALYTFMVGVNLTSAIICGLLGGFKANDVAKELSKGLAGLVLVGFVIGLARVMSDVMGAGNILHTIVYFLTLPLMNLPRSVSSVGMTAVICIINLLIPSASSKAAILVPIIKPIGEVLNLSPELTVQAFQYGDGFTNLLSPMLGMVVGALAIADVPFSKWFKWVLPKVLICLVLSFGIIVLLTECGWTAF